MTVEPLGSRVLIKILDEGESKTASGIYVPETAKEKPQEGIVAAVSQDENEDIPLEVGDKVLFAKYAGTEIKVDDEPHLLLDISDVLARISD